MSLIGLCLIWAVGLGALIGPALYGVDPFDIVGAPFQEPLQEPIQEGFRKAPLGTDYVGRDILAAILSGGRASLSVGLFAALITAAIGLSLGSASGYFGGALDAFFMKVTEFFQVLPTLLLAMVLVTIFGSSLLTVTLSIGVASWMNVARIARAEFMRLREMDFVRSAVAAGSGPWGVIAGTILPNALPPILVAAAFDVGYAILLEGSLSFLGLGDSNRMSWGLIIGQNRKFVLDAWWTAVFPGAAIFLSVLGVCLLGDGLNQALDPKGPGLSR
jgi:peptide/nickel transport system permease protein